jgi:hypothetical protein
LNECSQLIELTTLKNRIVELEKADIRMQADINQVKSEITALTDSIDEVKTQMEKGFNRISNIVFRAMLAIISILLTALGVLIYNFIIVKL